MDFSLIKSKYILPGAKSYFQEAGTSFEHELCTFSSRQNTECYKL